MIKPDNFVDKHRKARKTKMRELIKKTFVDVFTREVSGEPVPAVSDDLVLLQAGLDSLGFAILVVELEGAVGFDPFSIANEAYYPQTFGEFVTFYEKHKPEG